MNHDHEIKYPGEYNTVVVTMKIWIFEWVYLNPSDIDLQTIYPVPSTVKLGIQYFKQQK